jgi:hypothetical protein
MAATRRPTKKTTAAKAKPAPAPVEVEDEELELTEDDVEETDDNEDQADEVEDSEDDELEELEEDEVEETKPTTKKAASAPSFGIRELVALIKAETGDDTTPRAVRILIRKLARDESGRVNREIKAGNKERYSWTGPNDAEVRAIVAAYKGGELEEEKKAKLEALKKQKAAKLAAEKADGDKAPTKKVAKKTAAKKAKPEPVEEVEDDEELDFDPED